MNDLTNEKTCPRCHHVEMKRWENLTAEEEILAARLPMSADFPAKERRTHLFCPRCWLELIDDAARIV